MELILLSLLFPTISYIVQIYPRIYNKYFGVDVWTLLLEIDLIRNNKHLVPLKKIKHGFILDGYFDYPPIFLMLLSFIPKKTLLRIQGFISPLFDALVNVAIFYITYNLSGSVGMAVLAQLIYTFIPVSALENAALLPRSLGYALFMVGFYFLILFTSTGNNNFILFGTSVLFFILTLLSHKFATQSLLFITIFMTAFEQNFYYILALILGVIGAIIFSRGYYFRIFHSHRKIWYFWMKNRTNRFAHQVYGNVSLNKNPDLIGIIYKLLTRFAPLVLLISNAWIISAFLYFYFSPAFPPVIEKMAVWILFFYAFGCIVLLVKQLTPIGEGYRYMEMTTLPAAILSAYMINYLYNSEYGMVASIIFVLMILGHLGIILILQRQAVISDKNRSMTENMEQMFAFINKLPSTPRIMCIPHQITTMLVYNTKAHVLVNFDTDGIFKSADFYPVLKKPIEEIAKKYDIRYLLHRDTFANIKDLKLKNPKILYKAGDISLIQLKK
jgi:hypothetical protein